MWSYYDYMETPGGNSLTFGTGVLMCLCGVGEIIWGLKFRGPKCAILWSEICSGPDYLVSDISSIPVIQNWWWRHNFPRKVSIDFPRFKAEYKGRGEKENEHVFFPESWPSWKAKSIVVSFYFLFWSHWCRVIWMLIFWGNCDVTRSFRSPGCHCISHF